MDSKEESSRLNAAEEVRLEKETQRLSIDRNYAAAVIVQKKMETVRALRYNSNVVTSCAEKEASRQLDIETQRLEDDIQRLVADRKFTEAGRLQAELSDIRSRKPVPNMKPSSDEIETSRQLAADERRLEEELNRLVEGREFNAAAWRSN